VIAALLENKAVKNSPLRLGLERLLLLRAFITVAAIAAMMVVQFYSDLDIPFQFILFTVFAIALSLALGVWRLVNSQVMSHAELFAHLMIDLLLLFVVLLNTGGASNPLISYLLVLLAVTATILPWAYVNGFAALSIAFYTFFILLDLEVEHDSGHESMSQEVTFQLHLVGMWVIFVVSAILISVFISRMASAIKVREANLAKARENEIRNEQLVAIGTLAAGTAHALGTPLSTMSVLLTELDKLQPDEIDVGEMKEDISLLKQQVIRCKQSLSDLTRYYNKSDGEVRSNITVATFAKDIQDHIINVHPAANVQFDIALPSDVDISSELSLKHAVINIIENSIKAASSSVIVDFRILAKPNQIEIVISDDGPGIPPQVIENFGEPFISLRKESMGIGIFLANAAIQKLNGSIELHNLKGGGAQTLIKLPIGTSSNGGAA
jgi:two-component system, sensor histidine kinase RegB